MKIIITLLILMLNTMYGNNIIAQDTKSKTFTGNISLTGIVQTGNTERMLLNNRLTFIWNNKNRNIQFKSIDRYVYGTKRKTNSENDIRSSNYALFNNQNRWNPTIGFFFEKFKQRGIDAILKPMIGIQYKLLEKENFLILPQLGVGYTWKQYARNDFLNFENNGSNNINGTNLNLLINAMVKPFGDKTTFNIFGIYQLGIEQKNDHRFFFDLNMQIPIWKGLNARFSLNNYFENIILEGTKKNDVNISYGFGLKW